MDKNNIKVREMIKRTLMGDIETEYSEQNALLYDELATLNPWIIAKYYNHVTKEWGCGEYFRTESEARKKWITLWSGSCYR